MLCDSPRARLIDGVLALAERLQIRAERRNPGAYFQLGVVASVRAPFGRGYDEASRRAGIHVTLTLVYEPIGESAAVEADTVDLAIVGDRVVGLTFDRGVERTALPDETLTAAYADALLEQIADFCEPAFEPE